MIQRPTGADMPVYASLSTMRQQPTQDEIANGVIPLDTLPANWWNWLWNTITRAQNDLQYNDEVIFTEINNVLAAGGIQPNPTADAQATHDQLIRAINIIKNAVATTTTLGVVKSSDTGTDGTVRVNTGGTMNVNGFGDLATLHTVSKDTVTDAINEVHDEMDALNTNLTQEIQNEASEIRGEIGTLSSLTTTAKNNLVAAVNELQSEVNTANSTANTNKTAIGTLSSLTTTAKTNLVAAVNEVQSEVNTANSTANTNKTAIGTLSSLTTTAKTNLVAAVNEVKALAVANDNTYRYTYRYTYVVDSNAKLTAWANNSGGNDYTSVLIRKGTWTSTKGVNLTAAGTKVVVGEAGSKLVFNNVEKGLYYDTIPTSPEYYMTGVTVIACATGTSRGFYACANLTNCRASGTGNDTGIGFQECTNITNCRGTGSGNAASTRNGTGTGFQGCTNITNCSGTGAGTRNGTGTGFQGCTNITNCSGTGTGTRNGIGNGYGFGDCTGVAHCKAGGHCTTDVFKDCYASSYSTGTGTYACADTPSGGFNNPANPRA